MPDKPIDRVPNLPNGRITDENGYPSPEESLWRQTTFSFMQNNLGSEGLVAPTQTAADITTIQNNQVPNPSDPTNPLVNINTCQYGTFIYDETNRSMRVSINNGAGAPIFKTLVLI